MLWCCPKCRSTLSSIPVGLRCAVCEQSWPIIEGVAHFAASTQPKRFPEERREHLRNLRAKGHFWFGPRTDLVLALLDRIPLKRQAALEVGCADGFFLDSLEPLFTTVYGLDLWPSQRWQEMSSQIQLAQADLGSIPLPDGSINCAVALDVLEHVEPAELLIELRRVVSPQGGLLLSVPAGASLWSELDEQAGHRCRYNKRQLEHELSAHGWKLAFATHYQMILFPLLWASRRFGGGRRLERAPKPWMNALLYAVNHLEVRWARTRALPFGSSLIALANRR